MAPYRSRSEGAQRIRALEPCKRWPSSKAGNLIQRLQDKGYADSCSYSRHYPTEPTEYTNVGGGLRVRFPVGLWLGAAPSGMPDLRIELVRIQWGNTGADSSPWRSSRESCTLHHSSNNNRSNMSTAAGLTPLPTTAGAQPASSAKSFPGQRYSLLPPVLPYASTAGALVLLSVLHRDFATAALSHLCLTPSALGATVAATVATVTVTAAACAMRRAGCSSLGFAGASKISATAAEAGWQGGCRPGSSWDNAAMDQGKARRLGLGSALVGGTRRRLGGVAGGVGRVVGGASELLQRLTVCSTLLSLSARCWRSLHASSAALAEAVVDLIAVGLSYNCLAREAQLGRLPPGHAHEMAWRRRHQAAARRLARHLGDLPPQPPLAPALAALQRCSIAAGLAVDGMPLCGAVRQPFLAAEYGNSSGAAGAGAATGGNRTAGNFSSPCGGSGSGSGGGGFSGDGGCKFMLSVSYGPLRRRQQQEGVQPGVASTAKRAVGMAGIAGLDPDISGGYPEAGSDGSAGVASAAENAAGANHHFPPVHTGPSLPSPSELPPQPPQQQQQQQSLIPHHPPPTTSPRASPPPIGPAAATEVQHHPTGPMQPETAEPMAAEAGPSSGPASAAPLHPAACAVPSRDSLSAPSACSCASSTSSAARRGLPRAASASSIKAATSTPGAVTPAEAAAPAPAPHPSALVTLATATVTAEAAPPVQLQLPSQEQDTATAAAPSGSSPLPSPDAPELSQHGPLGGAGGGAASSSAGGGGGSGGGSAGGSWEIHNLSPARAAQLLKQEQAEVEALGLPLYGRADHVQLAELDRPMGPRERLGLACRAAYLAIVFLPFLTCGVLLLLFSATLNRASTATSTAASSAPSTASPTTNVSTDHGSVGSEANNHLHDGIRSGGSSGTQPRSGWRYRAAVGCRRCAWQLLLAGCRRSGAAFIKWGQWSATRVDLFPDEFCEVLSALHDRAPTHGFAFTRRQVEKSFGVPLERLFESFDPRPVASGSIAQVHRALMRCSDGTPVHVAVKVVHPRVELRIRQDFALLRPAAAAAGRLPSLRSLSLPETVAQFSCNMTAQADLRVEAAHLRRFHANFARVASQVTTPRPLPGLVRREVMVESWEAGVSVAKLMVRPSAAAPSPSPSSSPSPLPSPSSTSTPSPSPPAYEPGSDAAAGPSPSPSSQQVSSVLCADDVRRTTDRTGGGSCMAGGTAPSPLNTAVVCLGVDTYLQMLLQDNFVHTDLHPGNIMVRMVGPDGRPQPLPLPGLQPQPQHRSQTQTQYNGNSGIGVTGSAGGGGSGGGSGVSDEAAAVQLVLLDFGLAEELTPAVRHHFISFLHHLMRGDGASAASHILRWTTRPQACPDPAAFAADMASLAASACNVHSEAGIDLDGVMKAVLRLARTHRVTIDSCYASLVIAVCVIVGFATSLDPWVNLADAAVPALLAHALTGRVMGRLHL